MSEQQDQWRMTLPKGQFFENIQGDDALKQLELAAAVEVPAAPQPEPPAEAVEETSVPVVEEASSVAPIESEAIVENPVDAFAPEPQLDISPDDYLWAVESTHAHTEVVPPADASVVVS